MDYHTVADLHAIYALSEEARIPFDKTHSAALESAGQTLQTLCMSDTSDSISLDQRLSRALPTVGRMSRLTKLHLSLTNSPSDFSHLGQLSRLEDLALQCWERAADCHQVIASSKSSLKSLKLTARSWLDATYAAVRSVQSVQFVLKVSELFGGGVFPVGRTHRAAGIQVMILGCHTMADNAFKALSIYSANITVLFMKVLTQAQSQQLQSINSLQ